MCVTQTGLAYPTSNDLKVDIPFVVSFPKNLPAAVQCGYGDARRGKLWALVQQQGKIIQSSDGKISSDSRYRVTTLAYSYSLWFGDDPDGCNEIIAFHWDPYSPREKRHYGHMHIGGMVLNPDFSKRPWSLRKAHVFTDRISLESFVRLLIHEFNVVPKVPNWEKRLSASEKKYLMHRTPSYLLQS